MGEMADYYAQCAEEYEAHFEAQREFCATKWMTAEGKVIHYRRMSDIHLFNAYQMLKRKLLTGQISNSILLRIQMNAMDAELQFREAISGKLLELSMRGWNSRTGRVEEYDRPENALQILEGPALLKGTDALCYLLAHCPTSLKLRAACRSRDWVLADTRPRVTQQFSMTTSYMPKILEEPCNWSFHKQDLPACVKAGYRAKELRKLLLLEYRQSQQSQKNRIIIEGGLK